MRKKNEMKMGNMNHESIALELTLNEMFYLSLDSN